MVLQMENCRSDSRLHDLPPISFNYYTAAQVIENIGKRCFKADKPRTLNELLHYIQHVYKHMPDGRVGLRVFNQTILEVLDNWETFDVSHQQNQGV